MAQKRQMLAVKQSSRHPCISLPPNISEILTRDPKLIGFIAARHKLVAKIFQNCEVLEIGCQEGFGTLFVAPYVKRVTCIDFYPPFIKGFHKYCGPHLPNAHAFLADILLEPIKGEFDGAYALDVLEHIDKKHEDRFWKNIKNSIKKNGKLIVGMPSLESQTYASRGSKIGHVNCKSGAALLKKAKMFFENVILISFNDEMMHMGFAPMSHYLVVICSGKK